MYEGFPLIFTYRVRDMNTPGQEDGRPESRGVLVIAGDFLQGPECHGGL